MADQSQEQGDQKGNKGLSYAPFFGVQGRNGYDDPFLVAQNQCCEAKNVDWYGAALGRRRGGASALSITGGTAFASRVTFLGKFVPGSDQAAAELWGIDGTGLTKRLAGGTSWADVSKVDAFSGNPDETNAIGFNGKYFWCYDSAVNRLHCYDPVDGTIRRTGIAVPVAATVANSAGGGAYAAVKRYYRVRWVRRSGSTPIIWSELSPSVSFTPDGSHASAVITRPAAAGEQETHWEVFGSLDDANYFSVSVIALATTTYADSADPTTYSGSAPPSIGSHLPAPSAKFIVADDARLIMGGAYETSGGEVTPLATRIWWSSQLGSSNVGDDERVSITDTIENFDDLDQPVTGLSQPVQGAFLAFSYEGQWKFVATGEVTSPYQRTKVAGGQGCINHKSIIVAHDDAGYPSTYWLSRRGAERAGRNGNQFCGADISDVWATVNLNSRFTCGLYHQDIHQIWWYVSVGTSGSSAELNTKIVFDTWLGQVVDVYRLGAVRGGWSIHDGESAKVYCCCMFSDTVGASMGLLQKPYIGYSGATAVWKCDTTDTNDAGNAFRAYIESKPFAPWGLGRQGGMISEAMLAAKAASGVSIQLEVIRDEFAETLTSTCLLTDTSDGGVAVRVFPQFEGSQLSLAKTMRFRIGDASTVSVTPWLLDALVTPVEGKGDW